VAEGRVFGTQWSHVDRAGRLVALSDSKNNDPQSMPLDDELLEVIGRRTRIPRRFLRASATLALSNAARRDDASRYRRQRDSIPFGTGNATDTQAKNAGVS